MEALGDAHTLPSTEEWARSAVPSGNSRRCIACFAPAEVREALNTVLAMRSRDETLVSLSQLAEYITQRFGVKIGRYTLQNHFSHHTPIKWKSGH